MNIFGTIVLLSYPLVTLFFYKKLEYPRALILTVVCGVMFLPQWSLFSVGPINYDKTFVIVLAMLVGRTQDTTETYSNAKLDVLDLPAILLCFVVPAMSSLLNGLGAYDALYSVINSVISWFVFYWFGRKYLYNPDNVLFFGEVLVYGGLVYSLLCLFEIRMSPQLSNIFYGFFPHSFAQHVRAGGYRPIVFMQHGLMVSLWMANASIMAFAFWCFGHRLQLLKVSLLFVFLYLSVVTVLTKSLGSTLLLGLGVLLVSLFRFSKTLFPLKLIILAIPVYLYLRLSGIVDSRTVYQLVADYFEPERVESLMFRLSMEDVMLNAIRRQPLFGWGWVNRGFTYDEFSVFGMLVVDSYFIIISLTNGISRLFLAFLSLLLGPLLMIKQYKERFMNKDYQHAAFPIAAVFGIMLVLFAVDSLLNSMINVVYLVLTGTLVGYHLYHKNRGALNEVSFSEVPDLENKM